MRYLCQVSSYIELLTFLNDCFAALQIVCPPELADRRISPRLDSLTVYWLVPFIWQFFDLKVKVVRRYAVACIKILAKHDFR